MSKKAQARVKIVRAHVLTILKIEKGKSIMDYFKVTERCIRCLKPLRENGTCQNPKCVRYKPEPEKQEEEVKNDGAK